MPEHPNIAAFLAGLKALGAVDMRDMLPRTTRYLERVDPALIRSGTLHYNGPATNIKPTVTAEIAYIRGIADYHMKKNWAEEGRPIVLGHGLMYDLVVGATGTPYITRPFEDVTWSCANADGNAYSLHLLIPIGGSQRPTARQWNMGTQIFDLACQSLVFERSLWLGHREWPKYDKRGRRVANSECPGNVLFPMLKEWREQPVAKRYRVIAPAGLKVRCGAGTGFPVARDENQPDGLAIYEAGHEFDGLKLVRGEVINGNPWWVWRADKRGFMPLAYLEEVR